mmetsp:Transcript_63228/g.112828  ORF Transcript_63228/g.112828 Transcript_63228/m.112828 type:complete len:95 (+) Transcript_63228:1080-1364(+)
MQDNHNVALSCFCIYLTAYIMHLFVNCVVCANCVDALQPPQVWLCACAHALRGNMPFPVLCIKNGKPSTRKRKQEAGCIEPTNSTSCQSIDAAN